MALMKDLIKLRTCIKPLGIHCQFFRENSSSQDRKSNYFTNFESEIKYQKKSPGKYVLGISGACVGLVLYEIFRGHGLKAAEVEAGKRLNDLPSYTMKDVSEHSTLENGVWVVYRNGVYDISKFIDKHPGGDKILMAAGGSVEPFWLIYGVHKQAHILSMLEEYRIGNLEEGEVCEEESDPYSIDPRRHPILKPCSKKPFNAEPPPEILVDSFITPQEVFYVRNHLPVPEVDVKSFRLEITGVGMKTKTFTLEQLKKLPKHSITASIQCAGNRRSEMSKVKEVKGLSWGHAVIGNAVWTGVLLRDLLLQLGFDPKAPAKHVHFEGLDYDPSGSPYAASIPIQKVLDPNGDVLLAYEMNGQPLSRDHGFPLRAIVPGIVGARNVKWLSRIILSDTESDSHWQQNDYKGFSPSTDWGNVEWSGSPAIQELPVTSAICSPAVSEKVKLSPDGTLTVKGYAWSGGGRGIVRVDVTVDAGKTWHTAKLDQEQLKPTQNWAWTLWTADIPVPPGSKTVEIWAKAVDSSYNTQPESFSNIWNLRGVLSNAYHRVKVSVSEK